MCYFPDGMSLSMTMEPKKKGPFRLANDSVCYFFFHTRYRYFIFFKKEEKKQKKKKEKTGLVHATCSGGPLNKSNVIRTVGIL